jgi:hypothetical protein
VLDEAMEAVVHDPKLQTYVHAHPMAKGGAPNGNLDPVPGGLY